MNQSVIFAHRDYFKNLPDLKKDLVKKALSQGIVNVNWNDLSNSFDEKDNIIVYKQVENTTENVINRIETILYAYHVNTEWLINKCIEEVENKSEFVIPFVFQEVEKYSPSKGS